MAREVREDITGNVPGQDFTSPSPCTHGQGAYGAPTGAVGGAADDRQSMLKCTFRDHFTRFSRGFLRKAHSVGCAECALREKPREKRVKWSQKVHFCRNGAFSTICNAYVPLTHATRLLLILSRAHTSTHYTVCALKD